LKLGAVYSHLNGHEWLLVHEPGIWKEIVGIVRDIGAEQYKTKVSKEARMKGRRLYAPKLLNKAFEAKFAKAGWKRNYTSYWVTDDYKLIQRTMHLSPAEQKEIIVGTGRRAIRSYNETDFVKRRVAAEIQFGKYSFVAYDLFVKHLAFFVLDQIDVGVEILPMKSMQQQMSSGPGYYEGALYDIARQGRGVPAVPLVVVGIEPD